MLLCVVILTVVSCNRLKRDNRKEKVLFAYQQEEVEKINLEIMFQRAEDIDVELTTSMGYTPFHVVFMSNEYLLLKKILSSPKLREEVTKIAEEDVTKKAKMVNGYIKEGERALTPMAIELLNRRDKKGKTPLKVGVEYRSIEMIKACVEDRELRESIDWNRKDSRGISPILEATLKEDIEMCKVLERVARPSYEERILMAVEGRKRVILEDILRRVDINRYGGEQLVDIAIERQDVDILNLLLQAEARVSKRLQKIGMMLFKERGKSIYEELLKMTEIKSEEILLVLMKGIDEEDRDKTGLMYAIEGGCSLEIVKKIVTEMSIEEVLKKSAEGKTIEEYESIHEEYIKNLYSLYNKAKEEKKLVALPYARNLEEIERLVEGGVNLEEGDKNRDRELISAVYSRNIEVVSRLVELGANIDVMDSDENTLLMVAAERGYIEVAKKLLELGADTTITNREGDTVLIVATKVGTMKMVKLLIPYCNVNAQNHQGHTALMIASLYRGCIGKLRILISKSKLNIRDNHGNTALIFAIKRRNIKEAIAILKRSSVDTTVINAKGETALSLAVSGGEKCEGILKVLKSMGV